MIQRKKLKLLKKVRTLGKGNNYRVLELADTADAGRRFIVVESNQDKHVVQNPRRQFQTYSVFERELSPSFRKTAKRVIEHKDTQELVS